MSRKKKIAIIGVKGLPAFGGSARANEEMIERLKGKYDFTVYTIDKFNKPDKVADDISLIAFKGSRFKRLDTFSYYVKAAWHALSQDSYDLIHVNHLYCGFIIPFLKLKYKVVGTVRGIIPTDDNKWNKIDILLFRVFEFLFLCFSDKVITVSESHTKYLKKYTSKDIQYIPNGVSLSNIPDKNIVKSNNFILFAAARIIKLKGGHTFLEAMNKLGHTGHIKMIGNTDHVPEYGEELHNLAQNLDVEFTGLIKDKERLFNYILSAKIFVFPSFNEGLSNMLLETASCKTPMVCSDIEENKAVFNDNEVLYFKTGDVNDLAQKIKWALDHPEEMQQKAEKAFKKLEKKYTWNQIADHYNVVYKEILQDL